MQVHHTTKTRNRILTKLLTQPGHQRNVNCPKPNTSAQRQCWKHKPRANHTVGTRWDVRLPRLPLKRWVLSKVCAGEEVCVQDVYFWFMRKQLTVREELKLLPVASLCSHNFKIGTALPDISSFLCPGILATNYSILCNSRQPVLSDPLLLGAEKPSVKQHTKHHTKKPHILIKNFHQYSFVLLWAQLGYFNERN